MISSKYVSICNGSHAKRANSGKITIVGVPFFDAPVRGVPAHHGRSDGGISGYIPAKISLP